MRTLLLGLWLILPAAAFGDGLPQVAPPGPGAPGAALIQPPGGTDNSYQRRLEKDRPPAPGPIREAPAGYLRSTPTGAVTDSGVILSGSGGSLRDPRGGVWNCTAAGCFSPEGDFHPLRKTPPAAGTSESAAPR